MESCGFAFSIGFRIVPNGVTLKTARCPQIIEKYITTHMMLFQSLISVNRVRSRISVCLIATTRIDDMDPDPFEWQRHWFSAGKMSRNHVIVIVFCMQIKLVSLWILNSCTQESHFLNMRILLFWKVNRYSVGVGRYEIWTANAPLNLKKIHWRKVFKP